MAAEKLLFNEPDAPKKAPRGRNRDPWGRFDTSDRREAYERKIERLRGTIRYLLSVNAGAAEAIRKRDVEIARLKQMNNEELKINN